MINFHNKYLVPMSKEDESENKEEYVECTIRQAGDHVVISAMNSGYREKYFYIEYFEYLQHSGYIK